VGLYQSVVDAAPDNIEASAGLARLFVFAGVPERALKVVRAGVGEASGQRLVAAHPRDGAPQDERESVPWLTQSVLWQLAPTNETHSLRAGFYERQVRFRRGWNSGQWRETTPASTDLREVLIQLYLTAISRQAEEQLRALVRLKPQVLALSQATGASSTHARKSSTRRTGARGGGEGAAKDGDAKLILVDFISTQRTREQGEKILAALSPRAGTTTCAFGLGDLLQRAGAVKEAVSRHTTR